MARDILRLPNSVVSRIQIARLLRELENLQEVLQQEALKDAIDLSARVTPTLMELAEENKLDLRLEDERDHLIAFLNELKTQAPVVHMSFAAQAPDDFMAKIVKWFRKEVHPLVLIEVGLQPSIAAGCVVRTTNKYFDFSVGQKLRKNRAQLVKKIHEKVTLAATEVKA